MPFPSAALSAGNLTSLRSNYAAHQYLSLCPNTTIFAARVNGAITGGASYAQIVYDTVTTGAYTDIKVGQTIILSASNSARAGYWVGRVRATPTSAILYINETSVPVADNDYIFVLDDYRVWDKLAREVGAVQNKDYDTAYRGMLPKVVGLQTSYASWCNSSNVLRIAFDVSASYAVHSGATIASYAWTFPAGTSVISGATNAAIVTVDIPHSAGAWIQLVVTDSGGRSITRHAFVHPASDTYPPSLGFNGAQLTGSIDSGWNATIEGFSGVSSVLDNTLAVLWSQEYYGGTEGSIYSTVNFVGRFRQIQASTKADPTYSQVQAVQFQIEGPAAQLARTEMAKLALRNVASPDEWDEITNLTIWRAIAHILDEQTTFTTLHDLTFDSTANTFLYSELAIQGGDSFQAVKDLSVSINAIFEFAPQGEARVVRDARYLTTAERNALTTVGAFTAADWMDFDIVRDPFGAAGRVPTSGGYYNTTMTNIVPLLSLAPGMAWDQAPEEVALTRQVLGATTSQATAQAELNARAGHHYKIQVDRTTLPVTLPDGYHCLIPSSALWYTWTIAAGDNGYGLAYDTATRWLLDSISIGHDNGRGTRDVSATWKKETQGSSGVTIQYPVEDEIPDYQPPIPEEPYPDLFPDPPIWNDDNPDPSDVTPDEGRVLRDGNAVIAYDSTNIQVVVTRQFLKSPSPAWKDISPEVAATSSSTLSFDFTLSNGSWTGINHPPPDPEDGSTTTYVASTGWRGDLYTTVAAGHSQSVADISYTFSSAVSVTSVEVIGTGPTNSDYGSFTVSYDGAAYNLPYSSSFDARDERTISVTTLDIKLGRGRDVVNVPPSLDAPVIFTHVIIRFDPITLTAINHVVLNSVSSAARVGAYALAYDGTNSRVYYASDAFAGQVNWSRGGAYSGRYTVLRLTKTPGTVLIYAPSSGGNSLVRVSTDYGATFGAAVTVGSTPGTSGGFDVQGMGGTVSYAAIADQVKKATTLGGAYANAGAAVATSTPYMIIPWYQWGSDVTRNTGSSPHYLLGLSALVGGVSLYRDDGTGSRTDITPSTSGTKALAASPNFATGWKGKKWAVVMTVSGTPHVYTTTNITTAGGGWTDRGAVSGCTFILIRRRSAQAGQLFWNKTGGIIVYTKDFGVTTADKQTPLATVSGFDVWG